jgi:hypothetical protein
MSINSLLGQNDLLVDLICSISNSQTPRKTHVVFVSGLMIFNCIYYCNCNVKLNELSIFGRFDSRRCIGSRIAHLGDFLLSWLQNLERTH